MNQRRPLARAAASVCTLLLALWAAGCGPGVGGTGTGGGMAAPAAVCSADFADLLDCPGVPGSASPAPGTTLVRFADAQGQVIATLEGNHATLESACPSLQFSGDWGVAAEGTRYFGSATLAGASQPASLAVQSAAGGIEVRLLDAQENLLLGPVTLQRAATPAVPPACP